MDGWGEREREGGRREGEDVWKGQRGKVTGEGKEEQVSEAEHCVVEKENVAQKIKGK